jgi:hypothetical protein
MSKFVVSLIFLVGALGSAVVGSEPAAAWCGPGGAYGSGLQSFGEETYQYYSTCDRDGIYKGKVRDNPWVSDGYCAHVRLSNGGGWFSQASSCTSTWANYTVWNAPSYAAKVCKGTTNICSYGDLSGA